MSAWTDLLPHRESMLLISRLISADQESCVTEVDVKEADLFCENKRIPSWVGAEYMAQTVALFGGSQAQNKEESKIGFLLGIRKYRSEVAHFEVGDTLQVRIEPVIIDNGVGTYSGKILRKNEVIAEASLTTYKPDESKLKQMV